MNKSTLILLGLLLVLCPSRMRGQDNRQVIKGTVLDKQSLIPIIGASVSLFGTVPLQGGSTDVNGKFSIIGVKPGRYDVRVTYVGYKEVIIPSVVLTSGKEVVLDIMLEESVKKLGNAIIKANSKDKTINEMSAVSARTFSMEEVNRYAGGRSDPARLAANFAGVSAPDDSRNDIVIRGNSPAGVLWRIEGMNIQNPNHFSTIGTTGGPVSALNTNLLKNSDFFTSAFPAEYGNANAGVFDLGFRKGNSDKREHTLQFGMLTGLEAMTEGPINQEKGSSYLIAYRYSFTGIAQALGLSIGTTATPFYQDIGFKLSGGTSKLGKFTLFGLGGNSKIEFKHDEIDPSDLFADPTKDSYFTSDVAMLGLKHFIKVSKKSYLQTIVGANYSGSNYLEDSIAFDKRSSARIVENKTARLHYNASTTFSSKINSSLFIKAGILAELMNMNLQFRIRQFTPYWKQLWDYNDYTTLLQGYVHAKYNLSDKLTLNAGLHGQALTLNASKAIEPRVGMRYAMTPKSSLSLGYGLHSQMQPTDVYFFRTLMPDGRYVSTNKGIGFTRSHHLVAGYEMSPAKDWRVKTEIYYQALYNVPVTSFNSSYSMLNAGASFYPNNHDSLVNKGKGSNYGIELTIEKFYSKGYYGLITATLYQSKYEGSDQIERNTAFNGRYVYNILLGRELKMGKAKRNALTMDVKMTRAGGRYYTPVDLEASQAAREQVEKGDAFAFTERNPDFFRLDIKAGVVINGKTRKLSHALFFDIQNVTDNKNVFAQRYNQVTRQINTSYQIGLFPNFVYKLQF